MSSAVWSKNVQEPRYHNGVLVTVRSESLNKSGANTPAFAEKVRLGQQLPQNAYVLSKSLTIQPMFATEVVRWTGNTSTTVTPKRGDIASDWAAGYNTTVSPITAANIQNEALRSFWSNASKERSDFGMMAAEGRKTAGLITNTAVRLAGCYRALRRLDVWGAYRALAMQWDKTGRKLQKRSRSVGPAGHSRFAASAFLEMSYGWKPLLYDIYTSAEVLANRNRRKPDDVVIRGYAEGVSNYTYTVTPAYQANKGSFKVLAIGDNCRRYGIAYACRYRVANPALRIASSLGLTNPLQLAWELLPGSFIVDWFMPVGNYFESLSALQGLQYIGGVRSTIDTVDQSICLSGNGPISQTTFLQNRIQGMAFRDFHTVAFTRAATSSPSRPGPFGLKPEAMGSDRPLKALALLRNAFRGK